MIYILKKSNKSYREKKIELQLPDAKLFLYNLESKEFVLNDFFVFSANKQYEMDELVAYFNPQFLQVETYEGLSIYRVNKNILKRDRVIGQGATIVALTNFGEKIEATIPDSKVTLQFEAEAFIVLIAHPTGDIKLVCDYNLTIHQSLAANREGRFVDIAKNDAMVRVVNKIFRKQRYYYRKKASTSGPNGR